MGPPSHSANRPAQFDQVVLPHLDAAFNLALWLVRDRVLAQDVVQDAAVRALGYFGSFRGGDGRAWLLRIVRRAAYDAMDARSRQRGADVGDGSAVAALVDPADDPEAALALAQSRTIVDRAIAGLPVELRECLILRELEEMSYKEIASIIGAPVGTVMSRLWRARQLLLQVSGGTHER